MASAIHQEITLNAKPDRVFAALTDPEKFGTISGAPAEISPEAGASFSIFGGMINGRNVEVVPGRRLVQAWRVKGWPEGVYSVVRFDLRDENGGTRLVLDHAGYPEGADEHLAPGWKTNYWEPLEKYFS